MRSAMRASVAGVGAAACLAFVAPAAQARVESAHALRDPQTTYTISGNTLTIQSSDPVLLEFVRGSEVQASCYAARTSHRSGSGLVRWREDASSITVRYAMPVQRPGECEALWVGGGAHPLPIPSVFSVAAFTAYWRTHNAWVLPPGPLLAQAQLAEEWQGIESMLPVRYLNPYPIPASLPPARAVVRLVNTRVRTGRLPLGSEELPLRYARIVAGVKVPAVPYVIGGGSATKRLELAELGLDGKRYAYRVKVGPPIHVRFGPA